MKFDPIEEFPPEQEVRADYRSHSEGRYGSVDCGSQQDREGRCSARPGARVASIRSLGLSVLFVAAVAPWVLLTRDQINASNGYSPPPTGNGHAPEGTAAVVRQGQAAAQTAAAIETATRRPPVGPAGRTREARARLRSAAGHPPGVEATTSKAVEVHGSTRGTNAPLLPPSSAPGASRAVSDVIRVSELEVRESVIPNGSSESGTESQPRTTPTVGARRVEVTAEAFDPDGDAMSFKWTAPAGHFANPLAQHTEFTCPSAPATVPVTIAVTDANGAVARETITVHCVDTAR